MILDCCSSPVIPVVTFLTPLAEHLSFTRLRRQAVCVVSVTYHCGQDVSLSLTTPIGVNLALFKMECRGKHAGAHSDSAAQGPTGPQELTFLGQSWGPVGPCGTEGSTPSYGHPRHLRHPLLSNRCRMPSKSHVLEPRIQVCSRETGIPERQEAIGNGGRGGGEGGGESSSRTKESNTSSPSAGDRDPSRRS